MVTLEQIDRWRAERGEHSRLEFKEAKSQFGFDDVCKYCVALANEGGGYLVLGVADRPPRAVVGSAAFENPTKTAEQVLNQLGFRVEINELMHPDGRVVVLSIPGRPRGTAYNFRGQYLMRSGASLVAMTEDRLRAIFDEGRPDWLDEVSRAGMTGQEIIDSLDSQTFFELMKEPFPTSSTAILERLVRERLVVRSGDRFDLLRLGSLLLARNLADFPDVGRKAARVIVYSGESKIDTLRERNGSKGYAVGFRGLVQFITSQLPQNEVMEDSIRGEAKLVPDVAIRELVANALVHQDFMVSGAGVMIEIFKSRVEVSNPGTPIVEVDRFIDGYQSRNERLADIMRRMGVCEEKGSGVDKVIHVAEAYQLAAPEFRRDDRRTSVVLSGPKRFDDMGRDERVRACFQHASLKWVMNDHLTNQSLRQRFKVSDAKSASISQVIAATVAEGLIKADSSVGESLKLRRYIPYWA